MKRQYTQLLGLIFLVSFLGTACSTDEVATLSEGSYPELVADEAWVNISTPQVARGEKNKPVWTYELYVPDATFICPHFSNFKLPDGATLVISAPDGSQSHAYTGLGKDNPAVAGLDIWTIHISGERAILKLYSTEPLPEGVLFMDRFTHGFPKWDAYVSGENDYDIEAICGADNSEWAKCYENSEPTIYDKSRAVCRLLINGSSACTGWLVGSAGHVMTNEHCIGSASVAANTNFEFMAEGDSCNTDCASWGACPGTVEASSSTVVKITANLDYALVQLPTNLTGTYGYFKLRESGANLNERIYIPQHPKHFGKKIAITSSASADSSGYCEVNSVTQPACASGGNYDDVGYDCDTQGGSSGSPVLGYSDHLVVALHHCANCPNRGVPIQEVIDDLGNDLPPDALGSGGPGPYPPNANFTHSANNLVVSFTDQSTDSDGTITSRAWDFGDNSTSSQTNPTHTYGNNGTYTVKLTVTDNDGQTNTKTKSITVQDTPLPDEELNNGQAISVSLAKGAWEHHYINVPSGASNLVMKISGSSGDADLYTRFGSQPTTSSYDCRPYKNGSDEECTVASPQTGKYYVSVHAYSAFSNVSLVASFDTGGPIIQYDLTVNITGQGSVSLNPAGGTYDQGTTVTLTANPASDWEFSSWSGDLSGSSNPASITMNADKNVTAVFTEGSGPNPIPDDSCEGRCGNKAPGGCWCDSQCTNYGDCCPDKQEHCD